jgi:hypothetical protein
VGQVAVGEEILNLEGVQLLLVPDHPDRPALPLLTDQKSRHPLLKDADFWQQKPDFAR